MRAELDCMRFSDEYEICAETNDWREAKRELGRLPDGNRMKRARCM